ncbi:hypothetical protein NPIL_40721 [Nephila pilipes]|nr:hypothetical protein NPIL_40721 [Nephila pilipes]
MYQFNSLKPRGLLKTSAKGKRPISLCSETKGKKKILERIVKNECTTIIGAVKDDVQHLGSKQGRLQGVRTRRCFSYPMKLEQNSLQRVPGKRTD